MPTVHLSRNLMTNSVTHSSTILVRQIILIHRIGGMIISSSSEGIDGCIVYDWMRLGLSPRHGLLSPVCWPIFHHWDDSLVEFDATRGTEYSCWPVSCTRGALSSTFLSVTKTTESRFDVESGFMWLESQHTLHHSVRSFPMPSTQQSRTQWCWPPASQ